MNRKIPVKMDKPHNTPKDVEQYYEEWTDRYVESFGNYFQALQTTQPDDLMLYIAKNAGIRDGMRILDAGCGIGGPAIGLARHFDVHIEAVTISDTQVAYGENEIKKAGPLKGKVAIKKMDFHELAGRYERESFDMIYFLESLCHSDQPEKAIHAVREVLKPKGILYIKDLYRGPRNPVEPKYVEFAIEATNQQFCLNTRPMGDILNLLINNGFRINFCRTPEVNQDFTKGNDFTAKYLFKLRMDQEGPWRDEGFIFLHWMETLAVKHY